MLIRTASLIKQTMAKYEEGDNSNTVGENETDSSHCVNSIQVPQRTGNTTISIQRIKIHVKKDIYPHAHVYCSISHNSQDMKINLSVHW